MFSRIRYAARVLSSPKPDPYTQPDITFQEEKEAEVSKVSRVISDIISFMGVALAFGFSSAFLLRKIPGVPSQHLTVAVGVLAVILSQLWHQLAQGIQEHIHKTLRVGERIAPFFGHKITRAVKTLKG